MASPAFFVVCSLGLSCNASSSFLITIVSTSAVRRAIAISRFSNSAVSICAMYLAFAVCTGLSSFTACLCRFK